MNRRAFLSRLAILAAAPVAVARAIAAPCKVKTSPDFQAYFDAKYGKGRYRRVSWEELAAHCGYTENGVYHPPTIR